MKCILIIFVLLFQNFVFSEDSKILIQKHTYILNKDGSIDTEGFSSTFNNRKISAEVNEYHSGVYDNNMKIFDENGVELKKDVIKRKGNLFHFMVYLNKPVPPGGRIIQTTKSHFKKSRLLTLRDKVWIYEKRHFPGPRCDHTETVILPEGAKIISMEPNGVQAKEGNKISITYKEILDKHEPFECRIKYSL